MPNSRAGRYGENCARAFSARGYADARAVRKALKHDLSVIKKTVAQLNRYSESLPKTDSVLLPPEFVWLSDNVYTVEKEGNILKQELRGGYRLTSDRKGRVFVCEMARSLLKTGADAVTPERIQLFLEGVQRERPLNEDECNLFLTMLRFAAVENICSAAEEIAKILRAYAAEEADDPFGAEMILWKQSLRGGVNQTLAVYAQTAEKLHGTLAENIKNSLKLLRAVGSADYNRAVRAVSALEQVLLDDPDGTYPQMDEYSQAYYRHLLARTARKRRISEYELARQALAAAAAAPPDTAAAHIGFHIVNAEPLQKARKRAANAYLILDMTLPVLISVLLGILFKSVLLGIGAILPLYEVTRSLLLYMFSRHVPIWHLPALELKNGVPEEGMTLVVIALLAADKKQAEKHVALLEEYYLANRTAGDNVLYGVLADLPDSQTPEAEADAEILNAAKEKVDELNARYGKRFAVVYRNRRFNERDGVYMAYERKRGAIASLAAFVSGDDDADNLPIVYGVDESRLRKVRYLVALDADTAPAPDSIRSMAGAMLHPLNRASVAGDDSCVVAGYGILQPRIALDLIAANATLFSRIFAGQGGTDPYFSASGDIYQNLFGDSIFIGKGMIDLRTMHRVLKGKIADNRVLSHDLLEGSFLRTGYLTDTTLTDGFPSSVRSFFKRQARWTRGDIQLIPFLFPRIRGRSGELYPNPLNRIAKYKIGDNLRRAQTSAAIFLAIAGYCIFMNAPAAAAAVCALAALAAPMLLNTVERFRNFTNKVSTRCHSTIYAGFRGGLLQFFSRFLLLPFDAFVTVRAIVQALWRMLFTKRAMLEWTTAAEAEKRAKYAKNGVGGLLHEYFVFMPAIVLAAAVCVVGWNPVAWLAALFWVLSPAYSFWLSRKMDQKPEIGEEDKALLTENARRIWRFFDEMMAETDNFLPPDNYQAEPCGTIAHRTSPTNIGLALLAVLGAEKLGFLPWEEAEKRLLRVISAVERMEKYRGHLYNWYNTKTLRVMSPAIVSSVDSGNLCASLLAAAQLVGEKGNRQLAGRMERLAVSADFSALYDEDAHLLRIAVDGEGHGVGGRYDMLASEARLTSFMAIAQGQIEKRHWRSLSRMLSETNGYSGLVSWSGSLFEYLMPNILLPDEENSLLYEANRYAVYCQRRYARRRKLPWGISESAFYSFDESLNYQYKAHGITALGLKNGLDSELVLSPYSTFLALTTDPNQALKNLRALAAIDDIQGKYGLYESVDFTAGRIPENDGEWAARPYRVCKSYMAHHMAMSLCSICNLLTACGGEGLYFVEAFLSRPDIRAYQSLLRERMPVNAVNVRRISARPELKVRTARPMTYRITTTGGNETEPAVNLLANSGCTLLATSAGVTSLFSRRAAAYHSGRTLVPNSTGIAVLFQSENEVMSAAALPQGTDARYRSEFTEDFCRFSAESSRLHITQWVGISENDQAEIREVTVRNVSDGTVNGHLILFLEPLCGSETEYASHPAFYQMFLTTEPVRNGAAATRRDRSGKTEQAVAMVCDRDGAVFTTDGDAALAGNDPRIADSYCGDLGSAAFGEMRAPVIRAAIPVELKSCAAFSVRFAVALGENAAAAAAVCENALKAARRTGDLYMKTAERLAFTAREAAAALSLLTPLLLGGERQGPKPAIQTAKGELWRLGISGDLPIVLSECFSEEQNARASEIFRAVRQHKLLASCGVAYDLCLLTDDGGAYERTGFHICHSAIKVAGSEQAVGSRGGLHLFDLSALSEAQLAALRLAACASLPYRRSGSAAAALPIGKTKAARPRVWSQPLCNPRFGCFSADFGLTHIWYKNARLLKITPWDSRENGESLFALTDGVRIPLLAGAECSFEQGFTSWTKEVDGQTVRVRVCVLPEECVRVVVIEAERGGLTIDWFAAPLLAESENDRKGVVTAYDTETGCITAENPFLQHLDPAAAAFCAWPAPSAITCSEAEFQSGMFYAPETQEASGRIAAFRIALSAGTEGARAVLAVAAADTAQNAARLARSFAEPKRAEAAFQTSVAARAAETKKILLQSGDSALDRYLNDWAVWQIKGARLYARSSLYQNGGAIGFRDQLQDAAALLTEQPEIMRSLLLLAASRQYEAGDVQHWFHVGFSDPAIQNGVRTRCSDDLLWLPLSAAEYLERTGDMSLLNEQVPYLKSEPLGEGERERYENAVRSEETDTLYGHCLRAVRMFLARGRGAHGLPLILGGDWNDGMNAIGPDGRGESVWLAWFGALALRRFAPVCRGLGDGDTAAFFLDEAKALRHAALEAYDGDRFVRAYTDAGAVIGAESSPECKIDSIAQSFAWLSADGTEPEGEKVKMRTALQTALDALADDKNKLVRLFTPPFTPPAQTGYICAYPRGVRENGGQYTHAAIWLALACFYADREDDGWSLLQMLLPENHDPVIYGGEDFVIAADVYGDGDKTGMCGWSWYTGSAAWYRRAVLEGMLGIRATPAGLTVTPRLPADLPTCECRLTLGEKRVALRIERTANRRTHTVDLSDGAKEYRIELR